MAELFDVLDSLDSMESEEIVEYRMLKKGDHIAVPGEMFGIEYYHHGIFLGRKQGVAEFSGINKADATLKTTDLMQFNNSGKRTLIRINYPIGKCLPDTQVVRNAEHYLRNPAEWDAYDLQSNNCEHFAMKCKIGIATSKQVRDLIIECLLNPIKSVKLAAGSCSMYIKEKSGGSICG